MTKVVLDTNVLISATFWRGLPYRIVKSATRKEIRNYVSEEILWEFKKVLYRDFELDENHADKVVYTMLMFSVLIEPGKKHEIVEDDPYDNMVIDCAVEARADCIITQDKHLLKIGKFKGISILKPSQFIEISGIL